MNSNVHALPVKRRPGRRRVRPASDRPLADVLTFDARSLPTTHDEQLAECRAAIREAARGVLIAVQAIRDIDQKLGVLSRD